MKLSIKLLALFFSALLLVDVASAQSPREQLRQMVEQLQRSPNDNALREKIISLAATLKPAPAVPDEAERHTAYGKAAYKGAKSVADYKEAVKEFEQAALAAPWNVDVYYNLGEAQDKAENYAAALRSLKLALLAAPDDKQIKALLYEVEYRNKKWQATGKPGATFRDCTDCPEMVVIPAGSFTMGSPTSEEGRYPNEDQHSASISQAFAMGKYEVTQGQWRAIMGNNPSNFSNCGDTCPVEQVSWNDAKEFIQRLNSKTGKQYRLPSEAEWEYACRAGAQQKYCGSDNVGSVAWYGAYSDPVGNSEKTTNPVGRKQPNVWGLYDMSGNVWEWVEDKWDNEHDWRVLRGGSWYSGPQYARAADRSWYEPSFRNNFDGFRLARMLP